MIMDLLHLCFYIAVNWQALVYNAKFGTKNFLSLDSCNLIKLALALLLFHNEIQNILQANVSLLEIK